MLINLCPYVLTIKQKLRKLIWLKHGWHGGGWWDGEVILLLSSFLKWPQSCWWSFRHFRWCSQSPYFSSGYKSLKLNCHTVSGSFSLSLIVSTTTTTTTKSSFTFFLSPWSCGYVPTLEELTQHCILKTRLHILSVAKTKGTRVKSLASEPSQTVFSLKLYLFDLGYVMVSHRLWHSKSVLVWHFVIVWNIWKLTWCQVQ